MTKKLMYQPIIYMLIELWNVCYIALVIVTLWKNMVVHFYIF